MMPSAHHDPETFVRGKHLERPADCEDRVVDHGPFLAVVDGATDKSGLRYRGRGSGWFAAQVVADAIRRLDADTDAASAVSALTQQLRDAIVAERGTLPDDMPSAAVTILSRHRRQVWRVGDGHVRIGAEVHLGELPHDVHATGLRAAHLHALLASGISADHLRRQVPDPGRQLVHPMLAQQWALANHPDSPFGYGVINGRPVPERFLSVWTLPPDPTQVVLTTDGYPAPAPTLAAAELELAKIVAADPLGITLHHAYRAATDAGAFDDRAYLRVTV